MGRVLHLVPGLADPCSGIAVVARRIADEQGARLAEACAADAAMLEAFDEVWVHSTWTLAVWRVSLMAIRAGKRLVRMTHGNLDPVRLAYHGWKKRLARPLERFFLRRASSVVATCEAERRWIEAYEPKAKVEVVDLRRYDWGTKRRNGDNARHMPVRVLYMGRRHPLKGLEYLEKACSPLFELRVETDARGDEKESAFDWCDVFCLPTLSENFGIVVAEALVRGKPVVTTDGAPAWADEPRENPDGTKRLVYIEGYRDAAPEERVQMLKSALRQAIML